MARFHDLQKPGWYIPSIFINVFIFFSVEEIKNTLTTCFFSLSLDLDLLMGLAGAGSGATAGAGGAAVSSWGSALGGASSVWGSDGGTDPVCDSVEQLK